MFKRFCRTLNRPSIICQRFIKFCQSGGITPNLVTLRRNQKKREKAHLLLLLLHVVVKVKLFHRLKRFIPFNHLSKSFVINLVGSGPLIQTEDGTQVGTSVTRLGDFCTLGNFFKPLATINLPNSLTFLGNFCKGIKIYHFSSEIIFGQLLQTFGDFYLVTLVGRVLLRV